MNRILDTLYMYIFTLIVTFHFSMGVVLQGSLCKCQIPESGFGHSHNHEHSHSNHKHSHGHSHNIGGKIHIFTLCFSYFCEQPRD